jgi:predicted transcriptional regulator
MKNSRQLERIFKGIANHRRIAILLLIKNNPGMSLLEISNTLKCNIKTISEHIRKLVISGLVNKKYQGRMVIHNLSPYGEKVIKFSKSFK